MGFSVKRVIFLDLDLVDCMDEYEFGVGCDVGHVDDANSTLEALLFVVVGIGRSARREALRSIQHERINSKVREDSREDSG